MISAQWLAGFFDGEGCVNITVRGKSRQVSLRVSIINTNASVLTEIRSCFGGSLLTPRMTNPKWKPFRGVIWQGREAYAFLDVIKDFIVLKKKQVELALQFRDFQSLPKNHRCTFTAEPLPGHPRRTIARRSPETLEKELWFKEQMHLLNKKGVAA